MPDVIQGKRSEFIWYKSGKLEAQALLDWLGLVEEETGIIGKLYLREKDGESTYMEVYSDLTHEDAQAIAMLASAQTLFYGIDRRCEAFFRLDQALD